MLYQSQKKGEQHLRCRIKKYHIKRIFDIIDNISEHVTLVQLLDTAGNVNYALIIAVNWMFDSNYDKSLPLEK